MSLLQTLLAFAVALGLLVTVHEFGHYLVARACGVRVLRFAIGFGRPLLRWQRDPHSTEWVIAALPLGGYVRMLDESDPDQQVAAAERHRAFNRQALWRRVLIVLAGPAANLLAAIVCYAGLWTFGQQEPVALLAPPAAGSPAAACGLAGGERVVGVGIDGETPVAISAWPELGWRVTQAAPGETLAIEVQNVAGRRAVVHCAVPADVEPEQRLARLGLALAPGPLVVREVTPGSAADRAGFAAGDRIEAIDGRPVAGMRALLDTVAARPGQAIEVTVGRPGGARRLPVTVGSATDPRTGHATGRLGVMLGEAVPTTMVRYPLPDALLRGARQTWEIARFSLRMFGRMLTGQASLSNLSGPLTIADYAGKTAKLGLAPFVNFLGLISVSLAVLNLLPIPVLDGGHLLYYCGEFLLGRPLPERWLAIMQRVGIACLMALAMLALFNDVSRLLG